MPTPAADAAATVEPKAVNETDSEEKPAPMMPPVNETASSDIQSPNAPVTKSATVPVAAPAAAATVKLVPTMPPVAKTASSAATVNKLPNPIIEPSDKLRFSDNIF
jgi:hypothetical protein